MTSTNLERFNSRKTQARECNDRSLGVTDSITSPRLLQ